MTLSDCLALSDYLTVENLEKAYYDVIKKIRLSLSFIPVIMTTAVVKCDEFSDLALHDSVDIAIKEIVKIYGVDIVDSEDVIDYDAAESVSQFVIGTPCTTYQGFTENQYIRANMSDITGERDLTPKMYQEDRLFICDNFEDYDTDSTPFFWMFAYIYPYFCTTVQGILENRYDIASISGSNQQYYDVDTMLMYPVIVKAIAFFMQDEGDIVSATAYDNAAIQYIQIFNQNMDLPFGSSLDKVGDIEANVL